MDNTKTVEEKIQDLKQKALKEKELADLQMEALIEKDRQAELVNNIFKSEYPDRELTTCFLLNSVIPFIEKLGHINVQRYMQMAINKGLKPNNCTNYFCGICHNKIREANNG